MPTLTVEQVSGTTPQVECESVEQLIDRLERGWQLIEAARARGEAVPHWEDAWLRLLRKYEDVCQAAAPSRP